MVLTVCPACFSHIKVNTPLHEGQIMACSKCKATLEVIDTDPIELDMYVSNSKKQGKKFIRSKKDDLAVWEDEDFVAKKNKRRKDGKRKRTSRPDYI